jgi:hypothetical protein
MLPGMEDVRPRDAPVRAVDVEGRPCVIVDFEVGADHTLSVVVRNIGVLPANRVRVRFEPTFRGLGGEVEIPRLALFNRLAFLAPGRSITALIDPLARYLGRCEPEEPRVIVARITYRDLNGRRYRTRIKHDLGIWEDLPWQQETRYGDSA